MPDKPKDLYILLECITPTGYLAPHIDDLGSSWRVSLASPTEGSLTDRDREDVETYPRDAVEEAVGDFFTRMKTQDLPGVLDTGNLRAHHVSTLDFTSRLTEEISDDLPDPEDEDARIDDFDNHPLAPLREAMVDKCPEYSGEIPEP